jgi:hypothetical protein
MSKQFDLEQNIMSCWDVKEDLDLLLEELMENDTFTKDDASNYVLGLSTIYHAKFNKLFRTFEEYIKEQNQPQIQSLSDLFEEEELKLVEDEEAPF